MIDFYVSKHLIDFIDVWMDEEYIFYPKQNHNDINNFFNYFNGIFQEGYYNKEFYESNWKIPDRNTKLVFENEFFNNDFAKWVFIHSHFKFSLPDDCPEEEMFYFKLKYG